jgi:uncharacterized protein (UPF0548 family)
MGPGTSRQGADVRYPVGVFLLRRPSPQAIGDFVLVSQDRPLSYGPIGLARSGGPGFTSDELRATIGSGEADYRRAVAALRGWRQFDLGWASVFPAAAPVDPGTVVAVLVQHLGFWSLNGARVVYAIGSEMATTFGYAYGTLDNHGERGEEIFEVALDDRTGAVTYHIRAASAPRAFLAAAGYPVTRALQARFRAHSAAAMAKAVHG